MLICSLCSKMPGITVQSGNKWREVVLVNYYNEMTCNICIDRIEKKSKKSDNDEQINMF